jgi:Type IV secretion-system coupling protein DNA-binding domain
MTEKSKFDKFARGGDILAHKLNLVIKNVSAIGGPSLLAGVAGYVSSAWVMAGQDWSLYWKFNVARFVPSSLDHMRMFSMSGYAPSDLVSTFSGAYHSAFWFTSFIAAAAGGAAAFFAGWSLYKRFMNQNAIFKDEFLRGAKIQSQEELIAQSEVMWSDEKAKSEKSGQDMPIKFFLAGVPLPPKMAQRNILCTGGMGSGKSVAIFDLADQVAQSGRTMIIYDKVTEFARYYYREGIDVIFNPFDSRFPGWNIFNEINKEYEFDQMAAYLIPSDEKGGGTGDYFKSTARTVLSCILRKLWEEGNRNNEALCNAIFETGQEDLYIWLKGTAAESLLNPDSKGTGGGGVLTTLTDAVKVLSYVPSGDFSLKNFIREGGDRRLLITSKEEVHPILQPLTAMAMTVLYTTVMSGREVPLDKYWFFIDEFYSLGKLPVFKVAVTEARKYGAVAVIGAQNVTQFEQMFGKEDALTIMSNLQNQLLLRVSDETTAERYSKLIGTGEFNEQSEGLSWGAATSKDGASVNIARKEKRAVLASEIMNLPDRTGFMKLAGDFSVARVYYEWKPRAVNAGAQGWLEREDLTLTTTQPDLIEVEPEIVANSAEVDWLAEATGKAPGSPKMRDLL